MPHYKVFNADLMDEEGDISEAPFEEFYEPATAKMKPGWFDPTGEVVEVLKAIGVKTIWCTYDGGYDEGFAHFQKAEAKGETLTQETLVTRLAGKIPEKSFNKLTENYFGWDSSTPEKKADLLLLAFVDRVASRLLGDGFGTGELELRGQFQYDVDSGEILDIE